MAGRYLPRRLDRAFGELGTTSERVKALLTLHGNPDYCSWWDDFMGDALDAKYAASSGAGTQVVGITDGEGGTATLTTQGNADDDSAGLALGKHWKADNGFYYIARAKLDAITTVRAEFGVIDTLTSVDTGFVNVKATPTFNLSVGAAFVFDTDDDTNLSFVSNGGTTDGNADWSGTFSADTYYTFEILAGGPTSSTGDNVSAWVNGQFVGSGNILGSTLVTPWLYVQQQGTTSARTLTCDWWGIIGRRSF